MKQFSSIITRWYKQNKRDLPWRNTKDPYFIWLSEIILQQTRVDQGTAYYNKFCREFPTIKDLAKADNEKVMKLWQGLGYYSRARNLHATAITIFKNHQGKFPREYQEILSLKGVGEYTAAAISSFAFDKVHAVVDGNVFRVLSRIFGIPTPIDSTEGKKEFYQLANELIDKKNPALHNQAIMEFGALQCIPTNPDCPNCPMAFNCMAFSKQEVASLPVKSKKIKVQNRYFNYLVLHHKEQIAINKRTKKDIWINLYDFPLIETKTELSEEQFLNSSEWNEFMGEHKYAILGVSPNHKHVLSHQKIHARFWEIDCKKPLHKLIPKNALVVPKKNIEDYPVSRLIEKYLNNSGFQIPRI